MKVTKKQIDAFFENKKIAAVGVSRNVKKFGYAVFRELRFKGYDIVPVNPNADEIDGVKCYKSISELPGEIDSVLLMTPKKSTDTVLKEVLDKGIKNIWVQQSSDTKETINLAASYQKEIITGKCIFMFSDPVVSIHKFHRNLVKMFGGLPK
ncbi:MAG: CoA-binding protein [Bacteroidales bacterium]|nr:CoA-binding protein [Bacteroidales bacterium]